MDATRNQREREASLIVPRAVALVPLERIHLDEEALASHFDENSHECIMSCLSMHWVNDLPGKSLSLWIRSRVRS